MKMRETYCVCDPKSGKDTKECVVPSSPSEDIYFVYYLAVLNLLKLFSDRIIFRQGIENYLIYYSLNAIVSLAADCQHIKSTSRDDRCHRRHFGYLGGSL